MMHLRNRKIVGISLLHCCVMLLLMLGPNGSWAEEDDGAYTDYVVYDDYDIDPLKRFQEEVVFNKSEICHIECGTRKHTLCPTLEIPICDTYRIYKIYETAYIKNYNLKEMLIKGHNGLRDRIAYKMRVANLVKVYWDDELAKMTVAYLMQCTPFEDDPCTNNVVNEKTSQLDYYEKELYKWVVQNRFNVESEAFPKNLIEMALREWYFEKDVLQRPTIEYEPKMDYHVGTLSGENNFTHLANPLSFRVGCSLAQIEKSYTVVCNYYPFYRTANKQMKFVTGAPTTICPQYFPLRAINFKRLCTDQVNWGGATMLAAQKSSWIIGVGASLAMSMSLWMMMMM